MPNRRLTLATPSSPSGAPCAGAWPSTGLPKPMIVRTLMNVGCSFLARASARGVDNGFDVRDTVEDINDVPPTGCHLRVDVFTTRNVHGTVTDDLVVIVDNSQIVEPPMTSKSDSFESHTLLQARITHHAPGHVIKELEPRSVIRGTQVLRCHRKSDCICDTLSQRPGRHFDTLVPGSVGGRGRVNHVVWSDRTLVARKSWHGSSPMHENVLPETGMAV